MNNLDYIFNNDNIKPYDKVKIRNLTPIAFKELQQTIKKYQTLFPNNKTPEKTITEYQKKYNVSRETAHSDYIWLWTRFLQSEVNRLAKQVQSLKDSDSVITAIDYIPRTQDWNEKMSSLDFIRRMNKHLPYLAQYSKKSTYSTQANELEDMLIRQGLESTQKESMNKTKQAKKILKADKVTSDLFNGKYNLLAVHNLYKGLRHVGWHDAITVLNNMDYDQILRFWQEQRESFDLVFMYDEDFDEESSSEIEFLSSLYKYGNGKLRDIMDTLIDNNEITEHIQRGI